MVMANRCFDFSGEVGEVMKKSCFIEMEKYKLRIKEDKKKKKKKMSFIDLLCMVNL